MVDGRIRCGSRGRDASRSDDGRAAFAHGRQEGVDVPVVVVDELLYAFALDGRETVVRIHRRRVVAPDSQLFDVSDSTAGLAGDLAERPVVVQTQHGREIATRQIGRTLHRNIGVGIGRVTDYQDLHIARGNGIQRFALRGENLRVRCQQVSALHPGAARTRPDQ